MVVGGVLVATIVIGTVTVSAGAYPADAYNPVEKTILVSYDARADLDPLASGTAVAIDKAAFLAAVLDEKSVEIRWETTAHRKRLHARQAAVVSDDARTLVSALRNDSLSDAQRSRVDAIEARLGEAEAEVDRAVGEEIGTGTGTEEPSGIDFERIRNRSAGATNESARSPTPTD